MRVGRAGPGVALVPARSMPRHADISSRPVTASRPMMQAERSGRRSLTRSIDTMPKPPFLEELERRVLVCDGAMGTMLYSRGVFLNRSFDELNLTQPDLVAERAPGLRPRRRRRDRDQHLRRQPHQARRRSGWPTTRRRSTPRGRGFAQPRGARSGLRGRRDRAARRSGSSRGARPASTRRSPTSPSRRRRCSRAVSTCSSSRLSAT